MKISFDIDIEDIMAFQRYYLETLNPKYKHRILPSRLVWPIFLIIFGTSMLVLDNVSTLMYFLGVFVLACGLASFILPFFDRKQLLLDIRKQLENPENKLWFGRKEMECDDAKVMFTSDGGYEEYFWGAFVKVGETDEYFFLFNTSAQALVVPKQQITPADADELRSLFDKHLAVNTSEIKNKK